MLKMNLGVVTFPRPHSWDGAEIGFKNQLLLISDTWQLPLHYDISPWKEKGPECQREWKTYTLVQWVRGIEYILGISQDCPGMTVLGFSGERYARISEREATENQLLHYNFTSTEMLIFRFIFWLQITETQLNWPSKNGSRWVVGMENIPGVLSVSLHSSAQFSSVSTSVPSSLSLYGGRDGQLQI